MMTFDPTLETKKQFEARYRKGFPRIIFGVNMIAMPCTCEDGGGPTHWVAIRNIPAAIKAHLDHEKCLADLREMES